MKGPAFLQRSSRLGGTSPALCAGEGFFVVKPDPDGSARVKPSEPSISKRHSCNEDREQGVGDAE
jgi:hypothetical protein